MGYSRREAGLGATTLVLAVVLMSSGVSVQGSWGTVVKNAGIATIHSAVMNYGNVLLLDRTNIGDNQLKLLAGHPCRQNPADRLPQGWREMPNPDANSEESTATFIESIRSKKSTQIVLQRNARKLRRLHQQCAPATRQVRAFFTLYSTFAPTSPHHRIRNIVQL